MNAARPRLPVHPSGRRAGAFAILLLAFAALAFAGGASAQGADRTRPVLQSATMNGAVLVLTYDEALLEDGSPDYDGITPPQSVQFELYVNNDAKVYADTAAVSGRTVTLRFPSAVMVGDAVALSYTPGIFPIRDLAENQAAAFKRRAVTNTTDRVVVAPSAPRRLSAAWGDRQVVLSWDAPLSDGGAAVERYEYRYLDSGGDGIAAWTSLGTATTVTIGGLANGQRYVFYYVFEVRAVNSIGAGEAARIVETTPSAPRRLSAAWGDRQVVLSWDAPLSNGGTPIIRYEYRYGESGGGFGAWTGAGTQSTATLTGLANGRDYIFEVRAVNSIGVGEAARIAETAPSAPSAPRRLSAAGGDGQAVLSWDAPLSDGGTSIIRYEHRYKASGGSFGAWTGAGTQRTATLAGLANGRNYIFEVRAVNGIGAGAAVRLSYTLPPGADPVADGALRLRDGSASGGRLEVFLGGQWGTVCNDLFDKRDANVACRQLGFARGEFDNTRRKGVGLPILLDDLRCTGTESRLVDCGHDRDTHDCRHFEDVLVQCHAAGPLAPRDLSASPGDRQVVLSWDAPLSDGGTAVERYEYRYGESGASFGAWASTGTQRTATITGLANGRRYAFEVRAVNSFGAGEAAGITETAGFTPSAPRRLSAAGGDRQVVLSWDTPENEGAGAVERYEYRYGESGGGFGAWTSAGTQRTATVTGLANGRRYAFEVRAVNSFGAGEAAGIAETPAAGPLRSFTLVDAATGTDLLELREGTVVELGVHATDSFGVRADAAAGAAIGSVGFELTGQQSQSKTENLVPYSLYGDADGRLKGRALSAGAYGLRATVHAERNLGGAALQTLAVAFTVAAPAPPPVSADATLRSLTLDGVTLAPSFGGATQRYTASVGHGVTSVTVAAAPSDANATVAFRPAADADPGAAGHQVVLAAGDTAITVTVTAEDATTTKTYTVTVTRADAALTSFTLVDAATGTDLLELRDGTVVDLGVHATDSFGIRADLAPGAAIGSVGFELTGQQSQSKTENLVPYSLYGDAGGRLKGRALSAGAYGLSATVHAERNLGGAALQTLAVAFTVAAAPPVSADATLRSLTLDGVTLAPSFGGATQRYTASVGHGVTSVTVAAAPSDANATVAFDPAADADPGTPGHQVALAPGDTAITVTVTAGDVTKTYTVTVTRAGAPAVEVSFGQAAYGAAEGGAAAAVTVGLSADPERAVTVALTASGAGGATAGDWTLAPARVIFSSGETSKTVTVTAIDDAVDDDGESVVLGFAGLPEGVSPGSRITATVSIADNDDPAIAPSGGICGRTPAVRDRILRMLAYLHDFHDGCAKVTAAGLAKVEILELTGRGIGGLKPDDFAGLSALTEIDLSRNALDSLPAGVFADLTALTELNLSNNALRTLPAGVFGDLAALTELNLSNNALRTLSAAVLGGLHTLIKLELWNNALDPIPFAAFEALPALTRLSLGSNPGYRTGVEVSPRALRIARGATGEYRLRLTSRPTRSPRRATVSVSSESAGVTATPAAMTFTGENWFRAQTVTVRVDGSAAPGAATLSHAVSGYTVMPGPPAVTVEVTAAAGSAKTAGPRVAGVSVAPPGGGGSYAEGEPIEATVRFSEPVTVDASGGTPSIGIVAGGAARRALYARGSGTASLVFAYTVRAADGAVGGARVAENALSLDGGTIRSAAGVDADLAYDLAPVVIGVSVAAPGDDGRWDAGEAAEMAVRFSEAVTVETEGGTPSIGIEVGGEARRAVYDRGSGTAVVAFAYTVTAQDGAVDGVRVVENGLALGGGTIRDGSGNDAVLAHAAAARAAVPASAEATAQADGSALRVAGARAREGVDAAIEFTVTLAPASPAPVTVDWASADGTAKAGEDYTAASGTLTFAPGETEKTVAVAVLDDAHDEGEESFVLRLSNAAGAVLADAEAVGTIVNSDHMPKAWLARLGRTVTGQVLDAVEARLEAPRAAGGRATLAGRALASWDGDGGAYGEDGRARFESRALSGRELMSGTSFALTGGSAESGGFAALWGRGAMTRFDGREGALTLDGEVTTGLLGADWAAQRWTAGLAIGHSTGAGGYREGGGCTQESCAGGFEATLTGLYPYAGVTLSDRLSVWAAGGYGAGELKVRPEGQAAMSADLTMTMGAAGMRGEVVKPENGDGLALAVKGDARFTRTSSKAAAGLEAADADVWLLRTGIEGARRFVLGDGEDGATVTPSVELGVRLDGGDAETGAGADLGGGLAFADPRRGLAFESSARGLIAHEASGFREWGASVSFAYRPRPETDRGLALSLTQSWGASPSGGMDALLGRETFAGLAANDDGGRFEASSRLQGELGFGLAAFGGAFTGTPNIGFALSDDAREVRLGWRLTSAVPGDPGFEVNLDATRREAANAAAEHGAMLRAVIRW